jgi:hypothetical protein
VRKVVEVELVSLDGVMEAPENWSPPTRGSIPGPRPEYRVRP